MKDEFNDNDCVWVEPNKSKNRFDTYQWEQGGLLADRLLLYAAQRAQPRVFSHYQHLPATASSFVLVLSGLPRLQFLPEPTSRGYHGRYKTGYHPIT
jgi:hypothetical protein